MDQAKEMQRWRMRKEYRQSRAGIVKEGNAGNCCERWKEDTNPYTQSAPNVATPPPS
jgi:hypothetical protein